MPDQTESVTKFIRRTQNGYILLKLEKSKDEAVFSLS